MENSKSLLHEYLQDNLIFNETIYAAINFVSNDPPGYDSKEAKTLLPGQSLCIKNPPPGTKQGSKVSPRGHKVSKCHNCMSLTLFERKSFVVSTNKTIVQRGD